MKRIDYFMASVACVFAAGLCVRVALGIDADPIIPDGYSWVWWVPALGWFISAYRSGLAAIHRVPVG